MTAATRVSALRSAAAERRVEFLAYAAILAVAAALRLPDLAVRGMWDADQGRHMLDLRAFVLDGRVPLLGPATSIGNIHHGALYYFVLAPVAALSRGDPVAVTTFIAWCGVAAVAAVGWFARTVGGTTAGLLAAGLAAVSASAVAQSIFIWNPNLIGFSSAIALGAAWQAWRTERARWWLGATAGVVATMQFHVLGLLLAPIVGGLLVADARRRRRAGDRSRSADLTRVAIGCGLIAIATYLPLVIHELGSGGSEVRSAVEFFSAGGESSAVALPARLLIVAARVLSWPLTGLITAAPTAALLSTAVVLTLGTILSIGPVARLDRVEVIARTDVRTVGRWLMLGLGCIIVGLAVGSASLATVVPGLANDDYHAFADPMILAVVAVGLVTLVDRFAGRDPERMLSRLGAAIVVVALVTWNLANQPPARAPDGGWAGAQAAAGRVIRVAGSSPLVLSSLPTFKGDEALRMPLEAAGAELAPAGPNGPDFGGATATRVVLCDQLFSGSIGADCGGPAEDAWLRSPESGSVDVRPRLVDRFEAAPGRWVSVYVP